MTRKRKNRFESVTYFVFEAVSVSFLNTQYLPCLHFGGQIISELIERITLK